MLTHLGLEGTELSIALVDDATIQELNRTYRRKDKPTDVLAFPMDGEGEPGTKPPGCQSPRVLGDVIVSVPTARRQAGRRRRILLDELTMLLAHGLLHLLGYDHATDEEAREMTARTRELEALFAGRGSPRKMSPPTKSRERQGAKGSRLPPFT
jgi:probable rRNA maturation factor